MLDAAEQGATLISLTEMWACGFSMNTALVAEAPDGRTATTMHEFAEETGCWIAGSFPEHTAGHDRPTNRFLLAGPNGEDHRYSKTKPFSFAGETDHYDGGTPVEPVVIDGVRITRSSVTTSASPTSSGMRRRTPTCISFRPTGPACVVSTG